MGQSAMRSGDAALAAPHVSHASGDQILIRGKKLIFDELINRDIFEASYIERCKEEFFAAEPFEHFLMQDLFNPILLDLVHEEFDLYNEKDLALNRGGHEKIYRAKKNLVFGPASHLYFSLVNAPIFLDFLAQVSGTPGLIADVSLRNGGLHETRAGGRFDVHLDYNIDDRTLLRNRIVMLTYLNRDWLPEYGGDFELWTKTECAKKIAPTFGKTIFFLHSNRSYHGHPHPLTPPEGRTRRSVASYYYQNAFVNMALLNADKHSAFLVNENSAFNMAKVKNALQAITPPILWEAIRSAGDKVRAP